MAQGFLTALSQFQRRPDFLTEFKRGQELQKGLLLQRALGETLIPQTQPEIGFVGPPTPKQVEERGFDIERILETVGRFGTPEQQLSLIKSQQALKAKIEAAKRGASAKAFQQVNYVDPETGNVLKGSFERDTGRFLDAQGKPLSGDIHAGFADKIITDDEGEKVRYNRYTGRLEKLTEPSGRTFTKREEDDITKFVNNLTKTKSFESATKAIDSATTLRSILDTGNPITASAVRIQMPRLLGEVGNLTEAEQRAFGGSKALLSRLNATIEEWKSGKLSIENEQFLREIVDTLDNAAKKRRNRLIDERQKSFSATTGITSYRLSDVLNPLKFNITADLPEFQSAAEVIEQIKLGNLKAGDKIFLEGKIETIGE